MSDLADLRDREHAHITNRTEPYSGHIFDVIEDDIELASTRVSMRREFIRHDDAVAILAVRPGLAGDEVLLIRQYRHPVQSVLWEIPAGLLDVAGEEPSFAAPRAASQESECTPPSDPSKAH